MFGLVCSLKNKIDVQAIHEKYVHSYECICYTCVLLETFKNVLVRRVFLNYKEAKFSFMYGSYVLFIVLHTTSASV